MNLKTSKRMISEVDMGIFLKTLFLEVFEKGDVDRISEFYLEEVVGHIKDQTFGREDIKNRVLYMNERFPQRKMTIKSYIVVDPNCVFVSTRQQGLDVYANKPFDLQVSVIYRFEGDKIAELWLLTDLEVDYFQQAKKTKHEEVKEHFTVDILEQKRFEDMIRLYERFYPKNDITLTHREWEVLYYYLNGYSAKEIARELEISHRTVEEHISNIHSKYNTSSRFELRQKLFPNQV